MKKINFKNGAAGKTPLNATNLNSLQDNVEDEIITSKTTDIAEALTITDCAGVNGSLDIKEGKTIQEGTPTPTTPIDIRNVGDNIQLLSPDNFNNVAGCSINDKEHLIVNATSNTSVMNLVVYNNIGLAEDTYTISATLVSGTYNGKNIVIRNSSGTSIGEISLSNGKGNVTVAGNIKDIVLWQVQNTTNCEFAIKIEKGEVATSPSKYGCGSVGIKVESENVFDKNNANTLNAVIQSSTMKIATTNGAKLAYIEVKPNTTYTVSKIVSSRFAIGSCNGIPVAGTTTCNSYVAGNTNSKLTITTTENDNYLCIYYYYNQTDTLTEQEILNSIKVIEKSKTVVFPLAEGQLLHKGDYLVENGIHSKRKTRVLDGTEDIDISSNGNFFYIMINDVAKSGIVLSNYYENVSFSDIYNARVDYGISSHGTYSRLALRNKDITTVEQLKSHLAEQYTNGTPVIVEYELAEETITPYTEEQKEAYYQLQHLLMYEGYTSIECIEDIKPDIQVTYLYNNELNNYYGERLDEIEAGKADIKHTHDDRYYTTEQTMNISEISSYCKLKGDFAVINGTIQEDVTIDYPNGFNRNNCIVVSAMLEKTTEGSRLGYGSVFNSASLLTGGVPIMVSLGANNIQISAKQIVLTSETIIYQNLGTEMNYKIVLMKI